MHPFLITAHKDPQRLEFLIQKVQKYDPVYFHIDPLNQLVASNHNYIGMTGSNTEAAWDRKYSVIALQVPLITGELGQQNCKHDYVDRYMDWADSKGISYLGWTWNVTSKYWKCDGGESMIATESGTPSNLGIGFKNHFLARQ
jgi:endoglucanase